MNENYKVLDLKAPMMQCLSIQKGLVGYNDERHTLTSRFKLRS